MRSSIFVVAQAIAVFMLFGAVGLSADAKDFENACSMFGGIFEVTREGCDPDCDITYYCSGTSLFRFWLAHQPLRV